MTTIAITDIHVADRHRADLGDISKLAESLRDVGQLQPIVITSDRRLVAGERRLAAARSLGWAEIDVKIVDNLSDAASLLRAERDENTCRKAFTPTEEHSLYAALLELESPKAEERQRELGRNHGAPSGNFPQGVPTGRAKESVAEIVAGSPGRYKTLDKIGEVKRAAADPATPEPVREKAREALTEMDRTGNIDGAYKGVKMAERAAKTRATTDFDTWSEDEQVLLKQIRDGQIIVVSFREHHSNLVRWAQAQGLLISVDRRTEWGNPFEMPYDGDRETVIRNYADHYLPNKPSLLSRVDELRGKALACWCAPEPCHGDILKEKAEDDS